MRAVRESMQWSICHAEEGDGPRGKPYRRACERIWIVKPAII